MSQSYQQGTGVRFEITRRIGGGSFGEIFLGISPENEKVWLSLYYLIIIELHYFQNKKINFTIYIFRLLLSLKNKMQKFLS